MENQKAESEQQRLRRAPGRIFTARLKAGAPKPLEIWAVAQFVKRTVLARYRDGRILPATVSAFLISSSASALLPIADRIALRVTCAIG